jgi:hypothetical protein
MFPWLLLAPLLQPATVLRQYYQIRRHHSHFLPTDIPPMSGMSPFMFMQSPAINMQNVPASVLAITAQATQAMMANMLMNMNANMVPNQQPLPNDAFMLALQDTMRNHAVASWPGNAISEWDISCKSIGFATFGASSPVSICSVQFQNARNCSHQCLPCRNHLSASCELWIRI